MCDHMESVEGVYYDYHVAHEGKGEDDKLQPRPRSG